MLSFDGLDVDDGTAAGCTFHLQSYDFPEATPLAEVETLALADPSPTRWDRDQHGAADRTCVVAIFADDGLTATASAGRAELYSRLRQGATVLCCPPGGSTVMETTLLIAAPKSSPMDPSGQSDSMDGIIYVTIAFHTTPYWLGPRTDADPVTVDCPDYVDVLGVGGDVPALTQVTVTGAQATTRMGVGLRSVDPGATLPEFIQVYDDTADTSRTVVGYTAASSIPSSFTAAIGTPPTMDAEEMAGDYLVMARAQNGASSAGAMKLGYYNTAAGITVAGTPVAMPSVSDAGYDLVTLGPTHVPVTNVPAGLASAGYGTRSALQQQTASSAVWTSTDYSQTVTVAKGFYDTLSFKVKHDGAAYITTPESRGTTVAIYSWPYATLLALGASRVARSLDGWVNFALDSPLALEAGTYLLVFIPQAGVKPYYNASGGYSGGSRVDGYDTATTGDMSFKVWGRPAITYDTTCGIAAQSSQASQTVKLDYSVLLPMDEAALVAYPSMAAGEGICIDNLPSVNRQRDVYLQTATGTAGSVIGSVEPWGGSFMLRPGDNRLVFVAATPGAAAPGALTVAVSYRERYLSPGA